MHYQQMLFGNSYPIYSALSYLKSGGDKAPTKAAGRNGLPYATQLRGTSDDTMRNYYLEQSHGAYTVQGDINDWVTLDLPESYYGADSDLELHRRPHRPRLAGRARRHPEVRRRQPRLRLGAVRPGEPVGHHRRRLQPA